MKILKEILLIALDGLKYLSQMILVVIIGSYVFSGFGMIFFMISLSELFNYEYNSLMFISNLIISICILCSWVYFLKLEADNRINKRTKT